jgi:DNA-binding response OmpR family regulator
MTETENQEGSLEEAPLILIVDDDADLLHILSLLLKRLGVEVKRTTSASMALQWLKETDRVDLIILDLKLPDMDGTEVLRQIRDNPDLDQVPVMILSAKGDPATIRQVLNSGADDYLTKPYHPSNLLAHVEGLLNSQAQR